MSKTLWLVIVGVLGVGLALLWGQQCTSKRTPVERHVDSTLATVPAWQDTVRARDSLLAVRENQATRLRLQSAKQRARADSAEARADSLQWWANQLANVPSGITASDSVRHYQGALEAQKRASVALRVVVDSLKSQRSTDSLRIMEGNATIAEMKSWRVEDLARIDRLTVDLSDLRDETRHRGDWNLPLGIHLPGWTKGAVLVAGAGYVGYRVGKGS